MKNREKNFFINLENQKKELLDIIDNQYNVMTNILSKENKIINTFIKVLETEIFEKYDLSDNIRSSLRNLISKSKHLIEGSQSLWNDMLGSHLSRSVLERANVLVERSEKIYRGIFDNAAVGIAVVNSDGSWQRVNERALAKTFGYSLDDLKGGTFADITHPEDIDKDKEVFLSILRGEVDQRTYEKRFIHKEGHIIWVSMTLSPIFGDSNKVEALIAVATDITPQKEYETKLTELNKSKDKFFSIIAHDLRGPLSGISQCLAYLLDDTVDFSEEESTMLLEDVKTSIDKTYSLVENLLEWARSQKGETRYEPDFLLLNRLIEGVVSLLAIRARNKKIELTSELSESIEIFADIKMLNTVLRNLVSNAIKFTPQGGKVVIAACRQEEFIKISVIDTGVGLDEKEMGKLFKIDTAFSKKGTNKEKGSGLGLILCAEFVEHHGGKIWVESEVTKGSSFVFTIPIKK